MELASNRLRLRFFKIYFSKFVLGSLSIFFITKLQFHRAKRLRFFKIDLSGEDWRIKRRSIEYLGTKSINLFS